MHKTVNPQQIEVVQTFQIFYSYCRTSVCVEEEKRLLFTGFSAGQASAPKTERERKMCIQEPAGEWLLEVAGSQWVKEVAKTSTVLHQKPRAMTLFATVA